MKTDQSGNSIIESHLHYNHEKYEQDIMVRQVIRNLIKKKVQKEICERPFKY